MNVFDKKFFHFNDARVMYSISDLTSLVADNVTSPESIVRITEDLSFRAGDIVKHATSTLHDLLSLAINEPTQSL
jgi:hypothetical protein